LEIALCDAACVKNVDSFICLINCVKSFIQGICKQGALRKPIFLIEADFKAWPCIGMFTVSDPKLLKSSQKFTKFTQVDRNDSLRVCEQDILKDGVQDLFISNNFSQILLNQIGHYWKLLKRVQVFLHLKKLPKVEILKIVFEPEEKAVEL